MNSHKIVVLDAYTANPGDLSWDELGCHGQLTVYERTDRQSVVERCREADVVLTNKVVLDSEIIAQLPRLRYIGVLATGYNVVDLKCATQRQITVTNIPAYSTDSVAQMVFAHLLNIVMQVDLYARCNRDGKWASSQDFSYTLAPLVELAGKTIGIVGLGNIGSRVAAIAQQFGMRVAALTSKAEGELPEGVTKVGLEQLLAESDVVTLHCPLNASTERMVNSATLRLMKHGAILINTGRGPLVDEQAVADALQAGHLMAYAADVMCQEPPAADNPLLRCRNAFITPHIAWATREARQRLIRTAIGNVAAFLDGAPVNVVNA